MPLQDVYYYLKVLKQADVLLRREQDAFYLLLKNWKSTKVFFPTKYHISVTFFLLLPLCPLRFLCPLGLL